MRLRLGDWDCASCGHVEPATAATKASGSASAGVPTFAPLSAADQGYDSYIEERAHRFATYKRIAVFIYAAVNVLPLTLALVLLYLIGHLFGWIGAETSDPAVARSGWVIAAIGAFFVLLKLAIYTLAILLFHRALFARSTPIKWGCGTFMVIRFVVLLIGFFAPLPEEIRTAGGGWITAVYLLLLVELAYVIWVITLLWRDLQELSAERRRSLY